MTLVAKPYTMRDFGDWQLALAQQSFGAINSPLDHVMMRRESRRLLEHMREMARAHREGFGYAIERQVLAQIVFDELGRTPQFVDRQTMRVVGDGSACYAIVAQQMNAKLGCQRFGVRLARVRFRHRFAEQTLDELLDVRVARLKIVEQIGMPLRSTVFVVDDPLQKRRRHSECDVFDFPLVPPLLGQPGGCNDDVACTYRGLKLFAIATLVELATLAGNDGDRVVGALRDDVDVAYAIELDGEGRPVRRPARNHRLRQRAVKRKPNRGHIR